MGIPRQTFTDLTGVQRTFAIPFPYLDKSHVFFYKVLEDGSYEELTGYSFTSSGVISFPTVGPVGNAVLLRQTPLAPLGRVSGGTLSSALLNLLVTQQAYVNEEQSLEVASYGSRTALVPEGEIVAPLPKRATRAGLLLGFNSSTGALEPVSMDATYVGPRGPTGNTFLTRSSLIAAPVTDRTYQFAPLSGFDGGLSAGTFRWQDGDFSDTSYDYDFAFGAKVKLTAQSRALGCLVKTGAAGIVAKRAAIGALIRDSQKEFDDAVKITQFGAVGGDLAKDTAGFMAAFTFAFARGRTLAIPDSDVPFKIGPVVLPRNEQGVNGDTARPTKFNIVGTGQVEFVGTGVFFGCEPGRYFYDLVFTNSLRFFATQPGAKFIDGDSFIRLFLNPGLQITDFDYGLYGEEYFQSVRASGVIFRGGNGAFMKNQMAYDTKVRDCIIEFCNDGVVVNGPGAPSNHTCAYDDNVIEGMAGTGIRLGATLACSASGNYMEDNRGGEIDLSGGTAAHVGLIVQRNGLAQSADRMAAGAYSIVWGSSLATSALAGGNYCTGNLHDVTGASGLLDVSHDWVASGKNLWTPNTGRIISCDTFGPILHWFGRSMRMDPYKQEIQFVGKYDAEVMVPGPGGTMVPTKVSPMITFGPNTPNITPSAFESDAFALGTLIINTNPAIAVAMWRCSSAGTKVTALWSPIPYGT